MKKEQIEQYLQRLAELAGWADQEAAHKEADSIMAEIVDRMGLHAVAVAYTEVV